MKTNYCTYNSNWSFSNDSGFLCSVGTDWD